MEGKFCEDVGYIREYVVDDFESEGIVPDCSTFFQLIPRGT